MSRNRVLGLAEFKRNCIAYPKRLRRVARVAALQAAETIRAAIQAEMPVDTGFAQTQVEIREDGPDGVEVGLWSDDFEGDFYPAIVHYGRPGVPERPFVELAFASVEVESQLRMQFVISTGLELGV